MPGAGREPAARRARKNSHKEAQGAQEKTGQEARTVRRSSHRGAGRRCGRDVRAPGTVGGDGATSAISSTCSPRSHRSPAIEDAADANPNLHRPLHQCPMGHPCSEFIGTITRQKDVEKSETLWPLIRSMLVNERRVSVLLYQPEATTLCILTSSPQLVTSAECYRQRRHTGDTE